MMDGLRSSKDNLHQFLVRSHLFHILHRMGDILLLVWKLTMIHLDFEVHGNGDHLLVAVGEG